MSGWVVETYAPGDVKDATRALTVMFTRIDDEAAKKTHDNAEWLSNHSWDQHVDAILQSVGVS